MEEQNKQQFDQLLQTVPGGVVKLAFDDMLTILYATDKFFSFVKNVSDKSINKVPVSLLRMVYSADIIYLTQQIAQQRHRKDDMIALSFRTLLHDGSFRWVLVSGTKGEETYQSGTKTVPVYSCIATDATSIMVNYKKLEQTTDYHRVITELSKDLFFEYEIASDTLAFTEIFREVFGKDNVMTGFRKRLEKTKTIHAEELPAVVSIYNSMMSGRKQARFELRLIPKDGVPCWYTCYASIIFDENRNPYKVIGKLSTMNMVTEETEMHTHAPHLDTASGVCTKDSAELLIQEAATHQEQEGMSALLVIDIRNHKNINEIRRSINGDNIITDIGKVLKENFRTGDVIGRLGLSEFVVYAKGVPSDKAVYIQGDSLCRELEKIHSYEHTKNSITVSIGIAIHRGTSDYAALLANANAALVMAKKIPTSSFEVFSGAMG
jgi:putative two-component system response regulator